MDLSPRDLLNRSIDYQARNVSNVPGQSMYISANTLLAQRQLQPGLMQSYDISNYNVPNTANLVYSNGQRLPISGLISSIGNVVYPGAQGMPPRSGPGVSSSTNVVSSIASVSSSGIVVTSDTGVEYVVPHISSSANVVPSIAGVSSSDVVVSSDITSDTGVEYVVPAISSSANVVPSIAGLSSSDVVVSSDIKFLLEPASSSAMVSSVAGVSSTNITGVATSGDVKYILRLEPVSGSQHVASIFSGPDNTEPFSALPCNIVTTSTELASRPENIIQIVDDDVIDETLNFKPLEEEFKKDEDEDDDDL